MYPQVDIFSQLQNASEAFRTYIRDGLAQIEKNSAAGRTPSSVPISTPPPVSSPSYTSPKLAPPSPLNEKLQMVRADQNNANLTSPCQEDVDRSVSGVSHAGSFNQHDSRKLSHIRFLAGQYQSNSTPECERTSIHSAPHGTLDAIRERMKSIQAAAAGNSGSGSPNSFSNGSLPMAFSQTNVSQATDRPTIEVSLQSGDVPPKDERTLSVLQARMERLKSGII
jgi:cytoskeleton-associated protein 5